MRWPTEASALVAVIAACTINLRLMLYSASLAPHLAAGAAATAAAHRLPAHRPGLRRVDHPVDEGGRRRGRRRSARARARPQGALLLRRRPDALGQLAGLHGHRRAHRLGACRSRCPSTSPCRSCSWCSSCPPSRSRPSAVAAHRRGSGGAARATKAGAGHLSVLFGALGGIVAGAVAEAMHRPSRPARRDAAAARPRGRAVSRVWVAIVLAGIGTYAMRASFLVFAHRLADVPPGDAAAAAPDPTGRAGGHRRTRLPPPRGLHRPLAAAVPRRRPGRRRRLADQEHRRSRWSWASASSWSSRPSEPAGIPSTVRAMTTTEARTADLLDPAWWADLERVHEFFTWARREAPVYRDEANGLLGRHPPRRPPRRGAPQRRVLLAGLLPGERRGSRSRT